MSKILRAAGSMCILPLLLALLLGTVQQPNAAFGEEAVDARIEIVWPHGPRGEFADVRFAPLVNVEVYLFQEGTLKPVPDDFSHRVTLRWAQNTYNPYPGDPDFFADWGRLATTHHASGYHLLDGPSVPDGVEGQRVVRTVDGKSFPVWVFNDVLFPGEWVGSAKSYRVSTYFLVETDGVPCRTSVWSHSADPRTFLPSPTIPQALDDGTPDAVDGLFDIVWPHDAQGREQPVARASLVNIGVSLFRHTSLDESGQPRVPTSVGFAFGQSLDPSRVHLLRSLNNGFLEPVATASQVVTATGLSMSGQTFSWPRWVFDNVDVSAAQDPLNKHYFAVQVDGIPTHTTIWAHGADARTYFPERDTPNLSGR